MVVLIPLLLNSQILFKYDIPNDVISKLNIFLKEASLTLPPTPVLIIEATNLEEFHKITGKPYSVGGVYCDFTIMIQPVEILRRKGVYEKVLLHELLHWTLYGLEYKYQEGLIHWWLKDYENYEVDYFLEHFDGDLPNFIISHWKK